MTLADTENTGNPTMSNISNHVPGIVKSGGDVMFISCGDSYWLEVARLLREGMGWTVRYWVGTKRDEAAVCSMYPGIVFHDVLDAVRGRIPNSGLGGPHRPVDDDTVRESAYDILLALKMMDRMDPDGNFGFNERATFYWRQVGYWERVVEMIKPVAVIFPESPHMVFDYIIYSICKRKNIRTVMFESLLQMGWLFPIGSVERGVEQVEAVYQRMENDSAGKNSVLSDRAQQYYQKTRTEMHLLPGYLQKGWVTGQRRRSKGGEAAVSGSAVELMLKSTFASVRKVVGLPRAAMEFFCNPPPPNYMKQAGKPPEDSEMSGLQWRIYKKKANKYKTSLMKLYTSLSERDLDMDRPYIYLPLQYQPEKSSSPDGGIYVYQELIVDILARCLPAGWKIYVKENPGQFGRWHGERARTEAIYRTLAAIPGVVLTEIDVPSVELIDSAQAVATIRGSAGWEAVARGRPALIFGRPWYSGCEGVYHVKTVEQCKNALEEIQKGRPLRQELVQLFLSKAERCAYRGYVSGKYGRYCGITSKENARSVARAIMDYFQHTARYGPADESVSY